jgi:hypothetical protein
MRISDFSKFPEMANRIEWARLLEVSTMTLVRAEKSQRLKSYRPNSHCVMYRRQDIMEYLGVEEVENK